MFWADSHNNKIIESDIEYRNVGSTFSLYRDGCRYDYDNTGNICNIINVDQQFNLNGGEYIPKQFVTDDGTTVKISFLYNSPTGGNGDKALSSDAVSALIMGINECNQEGQTIHSVDISTTTTGLHSGKSTHYIANGAKAFDIDIINSVPIRKTSNYNTVNALQNAFDKLGMTTFGPKINFVSGHHNHIHANVH